MILPTEVHISFPRMGSTVCYRFYITVVNRKTWNMLTKSFLSEQSFRFTKCFIWKSSVQYHTDESEVAQSCRLFATPWTVACHAPPSMGFSRQESWSGLPFPTLGDLLNPGIKPGSPAFQVDSLPSEPPRGPCYATCLLKTYKDWL